MEPVVAMAVMTHVLARDAKAGAGPVHRSVQLTCQGPTATARPPRLFVSEVLP
jgi:hypothetical protein